jgi:hypothetical protein
MAETLVQRSALPLFALVALAALLALLGLGMTEWG